jgi:tetratricopeptide (TPR) repeat protein
VRRAAAFSQARQGDAAAIPGLLQILADSTEGGLVRANAAGYLGAFPNQPAAYDAVLRALADPQPLVRATAAFALRPRAAQRAAAAPALAALLADPVRTVRMSAAIALVGMGVRQLPGEDGARLARAEQLYRARAQLNADDAGQQLAAGQFFFLTSDLDSAVAAFRASLKLDPQMPARYYLGRALAQKGELQAARQVLQAIPPNDLQYQAAQRLLADLQTENQAAAADDQNRSQAAADFRDGQQLYQNKDYGGALPVLERALREQPQASWARTAEIYRAISLEKLGRAGEAEAAMKALGSGAAGDADLQLAWAELLYDTGRAPEALQRVDQLIAAAPQVPLAYFWRAKVLLELQRTAEAAQAAETAIRLQPELPAAHNLLIRIYQMLGRTREAAEQAQWLHDYQRRMESR